MDFVRPRNGQIIEILEPRRMLSTSYYVSPFGNDGNSGDSALYPWRTIERVNATRLGPGDQVLFDSKQTYDLPGDTGANIVVNGGFESGLSGWTDTLGTNASFSTITTANDEVFSGNSALKLSGAGDAKRGRDITGKIEPNTSYAFDIRSRRINDQGGEVRAGITFYKDGQVVGDFYHYLAQDFSGNQKWSFVSPRSFDRAELSVSRIRDQSIVFIDNISVTETLSPLILDSTDSGAADNPVIIGSYGTGRATINAGDHAGISANNVSGVVIRDLNVIGTWHGLTSTGGNFGEGIDFTNSQPGDTKLRSIRISNVDVTGFKWAGIHIGSANDKSGFSNVLISHASAYSNGDIGISVGGNFNPKTDAYAHHNVSVVDSYAFDNGGIIDKGSNSGSGILLADVDHGLIERSVAHDNGMLSNFDKGGPVGIWAFDANDITIQKNESYANATDSGHDGGGFDFDGGVTNSIMQYNYSHDNEGPGLLMYQFDGARPFGANVMRYNITQNDGREQSYGAISLGGGDTLVGALVENNTVFISPSTTGGAVSGVRLTGVGENVFIRNNIIQTTGGARLLDISDESTLATFQNNTYWSSGGTFVIRYDGTNFPSLGDWRSTTKNEMNGSVKVGIVADPKLRSAGTAPTLDNADRLEEITQYKPKTGSPVIDAAIAFPSIWKGYTPAVADFFGNPAPLGAARDIAAAEIA